MSIFEKVAKKEPMFGSQRNGAEICQVDFSSCYLKANNSSKVTKTRIIKPNNVGVIIIGSAQIEN